MRMSLSVNALVNQQPEKNSVRIIVYFTYTEIFASNFTV